MIKSRSVWWWWVQHGSGLQVGLKAPQLSLHHCLEPWIFMWGINTILGVLITTEGRRLLLLLSSSCKTLRWCWRRALGMRFSKVVAHVMT
jgi:hypothetical protein